MTVVTVIIAALITVAGVGSGQLIKSTNDCICPGDVVTYNCSITGSGYTIWRGSAFDCQSVDSRILLRHSLFGSSGTMGLCNDGAIMGRSRGITRSSSNSLVYMSQLIINLTASSNVIGQEVQCVYRNTANVEWTIGSATIEIADPLPPPAIVRLVEISSEQLVFNWTSVDSECSTLHYNIISNCGNCINMTSVTATTVACSISVGDNIILIDNMTQCSFGVQSVVCATLSGVPSTPLNVTLKVPESPTISTIVARYSEQGERLTKLDIEFNEVERFMISEGVDGSALSYTISYTDSSTGEMCNSLIISASSCKQGICTVPFISPLPCSETAGDGDIDIAISANNRLGQGPPSVTIIGRTNKYVNITFQSTNEILCTFLDQQGGQSTMTCDVAYGPCQQQPIQITRGTATATSNIVTIEINPQMNEYCYVVNASNGTFTVLVEGQIMASTGNPITTDSEQLPGSDLPKQSNEGFVAGISVTVTIIVMLIISGAVILITLYVRQSRISQATKGNKESEDQVHLVEDEQQPVSVHIYFDLEDKPKKFLRALQKLDTLKINIKNIKVGPRTLLAVRRVYMECWENLTNKEKQAIEDLEIGETGTLVVHCEAETHYVKYNRDAKTTQRMFDISELLIDKPGALLSLLEVVDSVEECKHINICDIDVKKLQDCTQVTIMFLPDMAEDWEKKYKKKRNECKSIVKPITVQTTL